MTLDRRGRSWTIGAPFFLCIFLVALEQLGATDDHAAEDIFKPGRRRLRIGTAQMDMIPRDDRHRRSPRLPTVRRLPRRSRASGSALEFSGRILPLLSLHV